jgi:hypothetical protein
MEGIGWDRAYECEETCVVVRAHALVGWSVWGDGWVFHDLHLIRFDAEVVEKEMRV